MDSRLIAALQDFVERSPGPDPEGRRLRGWLLHHAPGEQRAVEALVTVAKLGLHDALGQPPGAIDAGSLLQHVETLSQRGELPADLAEQALLAWLGALGVEAPESSESPALLDAGVLTASVDSVRALHLACEQAGFPAISQIRVESTTTRPLRQLTVSVHLAGVETGSLLRSTTWTGQIDRLHPGQLALIDGLDLQIAPQALQGLHAPAHARWWISIADESGFLLRTWCDVVALPPRTWPRGRAPTPALAAFVQPDDPVVPEIIAQAAPGVASGDPRPAAVKALEALSTALEPCGLQLVDRPPDQLRGPRCLLAHGQASWLELQLLLAACLEWGGMPPMLLWTATGPALGLWTGQDRPALTETDDPRLVLRLAEAGAMVLVPVGAHVLDLEGANPSDGAFLALDLGAARIAGALPMPRHVLDAGVATAGGSSPAELSRRRILDRAALGSPASGATVRGAWGLALGRRPSSGDGTPPRVQGWKRRLLDLTLRNPLLNMRPRSSTLPLLLDDVAAFEDLLSSDRVFQLVPRPPPRRPGQPSPPVTSKMISQAMTSGRLLVDLPEKRLAAAAKGAHHAQRVARDEGGVQTLFACLGLLEWSEPARADKVCVAPLLLVPVLVSRTRRGVFELKKAESETELNAALLEYLVREHGLDPGGLHPLPLDHAGVDVADVLQKLREVLAASPSTAQWTIRQEATVNVLSFAGYRMWRDLDRRSADLLRHPLVRRLALGEEPGDDEPLPLAVELDDSWPPKDVFCPLEADGSQLAAIRAARDGHTFVLEGPPGTGKSQTIANLIAQCLAEGETVLFVSQKRAALEVVHDRLEAIGLGPFTLELHSHKSSKPEFVQQLRDAAEFRARRPARDWDTEATELAVARDAVNTTARALHHRHPPGMSVYEAVARLEAGRDGPRAPCDFEPAVALEVGWVSEGKAVLDELGPLLERVGGDRGPLERVRETNWPRHRRTELERLLAILEASIGVLERTCDGLAPWLPDLASASAEDLEQADLVLGMVQASPGPRRALLKGREDKVDAWMARVAALRAEAMALGERWQPGLLDLESVLGGGVARLERWKDVWALGWMALLSLRRELAAVVVGGDLPPNDELGPDLERAVALRDARTDVLLETERIQVLVGPVGMDSWALPVPVEDELGALLSWTRTFRQQVARFPAARDLAAGDVSHTAGPPIAAFRSAWLTFDAARREVRSCLDLSEVWSPPERPGYLAAVRAGIRELEGSIARLRSWGAYRRRRDHALELGLGETVRSLEEGEAEGADLAEGFENAWVSWWLTHQISHDPALATFDGLGQRALEKRFSKLDQKLRRLTRHEIRARLAARQPRLDQGAPPGSPAGLLLRQFGRRTAFAAPRSLFSRCAKLIRQLKPCVLMSPQSVAQYIDPSQPPFDVVVFDEASQVPVHDAIGAIARGRRVIVVGDSKQLPPTSFFVGREKEGDDRDEVMAELDSILEECGASGVPSLSLTWHYRSRHPSLIAFSNARYYDGRLQVLPTARARAHRLGVSLVLVQGAIYERGGSATNPHEAEAVVRDIVRRLTDPVEQRRSLGVVTFSRPQQALIEDLLEVARERRPEIERFFDAEQVDEPVIVKNLENVQGDERDVILFSITYGPDKNGRMTANLGPLGQAGGERRLNVAVTRAREQLVVYASFGSSQLDLRSTVARGLHDLVAFLESAARGGEVLVGRGHDEPDPADQVLRAALAARLRAAGLELDLDVGSGQYRIDIAIRSTDDPDRYVLGVELDGSRYAATATARDRDRLRWDVLGGLGWPHLHRARALEWYEDPAAVVDAVLRAAKKARAHAADVTADGDLVELAHSDFVEAGDERYVERAIERSTYCSPPRQTRGRTRAPTDRQVGTSLAAIVQAEGPITERLAARRIGQEWSMARAPSGLSERSDQLCGHLRARQRPVLHGDAFWPRELRPAEWRCYRLPDPDAPETTRSIQDIPMEELANAAEDLRARYGEMESDDWARAVARVFGTGRLGSRVRARIEAALELLRWRDQG